MLDPSIARIRWPKACRIIPSRYPPIDLFEGIAPTEDWETLAELEGLTNDRLRDDIGKIHLVPPDRRVSGPGASWVMAPFTHPCPAGSRFSDGSFGIYYAGREIETALKEVAHHMSRFYAATNDPPHQEDFRTLVGMVKADLHDIRNDFDGLHEPSSYSKSQPFGVGLRAGGSDGIVYRSVRNPEGQCVALFWPDVPAIPTQGPHFTFKWDGNCISKVFHYSDNIWR